MKPMLALLLILSGGTALQASDVMESQLPPGAGGASAALEGSPRHGEWIDVKVPGQEVPVRTWMVFPERAEKAPVVLVIHEIFGLTDWIRAVADRLAADGFIALAPDLLSGKGPGGGGTESTSSRQEVVALIRGLQADEVTERLDAVRAHGLGLAAASGRSASLGFCWGGRTSFSYAASQPDLDAAVVFYGTPPSDLSPIKAPVLGLYGGDDARVTSTVEETERSMGSLGKAYTAHIYQGAGHGFLRQQDGREGANLAASRKAWPETVAFLRKNLE